VVVRDEQVLVVGRDEYAVGPLHLQPDDAAHRPVRVDAIHALDRDLPEVPDLHAVARAVPRVGEVDATLRVDGQVVGRVVPLALDPVGEDGELAAAVDAGDAPLLRLAAHEPALAVEQQAVGARPLAVDRRLAVAVEAVDAALAAGEHAELRVPRRPLAA